jgi:lactoylglutathione lyase
MPGIVRVDHVALWVRDLETMRGFYVERLGGRSGALYHNARTGFRSCFIAFSDGPRIELMTDSRGDRGHADGAFGYAHIALSAGGRDQVDSIIRALEGSGVTVESRPRVTGDGYYEAVVRDPEGNRIEITA